MKKLIILSMIVVSSIAVVFGQKPNNLVIFNQDGNKFWVILNGVKQNEQAETNVKVLGLIQPSYDVKIIFEVKTIPEISQKVYLMWEGEQKAGYEFNYAVTNTKKGYKLRGNSAAPYTSDAPGSGQVAYTYTTGNPMPYGVTGTSTTISTTTTVGNGNTSTNTTTGTGTTENVNVNVGVGSTGTGVSTTTTTGTGTGENVNVNMNVNGLDMNVNVNANTTGTNTNVNSSTTTTTITGTTGYQNNTSTNTTSDHYVMPGYGGPMGCPWPMSAQDFESAKSSIKAKSFDDSRLTIAKQIIGSNCLLCTQVKELMLLMSFEQTRLDLAKFSHGRTYDQGNYYKLNDAFTFEASIDELNDHINGKK